MKISNAAAERVAAVRAFNRFYTDVIGVLREGLLDTPYSLTEARVIFELASRRTTEAVQLRRDLGIDAGYLSRILGRFEADGLTTKERSSEDGRRQTIRLTDRGHAVFRLLDERSADQVRALLGSLTDEEQDRLVSAMEMIRRLLTSDGTPDAFLIRPLRPGDLGWMVYRHGVLYAEEYGWDDTFEALVARIVAEYAERRDPRREAGWVAEVDGEAVGSVLCTQRDDRIAQLRLLLVEPRARGLGIGSRLVAECLRFARDARYEAIVLWTNDVLTEARRVYERAGFELIDEEPHHSFGHDLVAQTWRLDL